MNGFGKLLRKSDKKIKIKSNDQKKLKNKKKQKTDIKFTYIKTFYSNY